MTFTLISGYPKHWFIKQALLCAAIGLLWAFPVVAAELPDTVLSDSTLVELSMEELLQVKISTVSAASLYVQKVTEAPASVTVLTADDFKKYGYRNLAEALRSVRGFTLNNDRNYSRIGVRGFSRPSDDNSRILVLVDGHRVTENIYDASYVANDFIIDADLIDRVEIIRGPGSVLYGSSAFFGVINVVSKKGQDVGGVEASFDAGSFDTYKGRLSYGRKFSSGVELLLSGSLLDSAGAHSLYFPEFDSSQLNNGRAIDRDYESARNALLTLSWHDLTLQAAYNWREKGVPTASFSSYFGDSRERTVDSLGYVDLKYENRFENDLTALARVNFNRYQYYAVYPTGDNFTSPPPDVVINRDDVLGQWLGTELRLTRTFFEQHKLVAGAEYRENLNQNVLNYDEAPRFVYSDLKHQSRNWGVFVQDDWTLHRTLSINFGLRYDHYDGFGGAVNPRAALIYHPWEHTGFKLIYGEAFRAPNVFESFVEDPATRSNPSVRPEKIRTGELVYEQKLPYNTAFSASAYYSRITDLIDQIPILGTPLSISENVNSAEARGVEFEVSGFHANGLRGRMSYAVQETKDLNSGRVFDNSPLHLFKANLIVSLYRDKLFSGLELQASSGAKTLAGSYADPYWLMNLTLYSQKVVKGLEASASLYNIFNEQYGFPGGPQHVPNIIPQDGRQFRFKLTCNF